MEERISEETLDELRKQILGKKIEVRDVVGLCEYFGYNKYFPTYGLQVTIGRMPITNLKLTEIKVL